MDAPRQAPPPKGDGSLEILGAAGEVNEVRLALRRCLAGEWPLDEVEILYTDRSTYLPLLFEQLARHFPFETGDLDNLPATFSEGIPALYSRPGKALSAWAVWAMEGYPMQALAGMVAEGLLRLDGKQSQAYRAASADLLTRTRTGAGPGAALAAVRAALADMKERPAKRYDEDGEEMSCRLTDINFLRSIEALLKHLEKCTPLEDYGFTDILEGAICFLETAVRTAGEFDEYARRALDLDMRGTLEQVRTLGHAPEGDPLGWIVSLVEEVRVAGSGPRPGRVHVAPLVLGGHSGRPHTFVLGLDDARFPGSDRQEPILLDSERGALSPLLSLSDEPLKIKEKALQALAGRISGTLTLTCSLTDLADDRDTFPSSSLVRAFRILSDPEADQEAILKHLSPPAGFVDTAGLTYLDSGEWWTEKLAGPAHVTGAEAAIGRRFPNLELGMTASAMRRGSDATAFDGVTGRPPEDLDIMSASGPAVSSNRLQAIGACPLRYFFRYILDLEPVEEDAPEPGRWLTPADRGSLLHELFHVYMDGLIREGRVPEYDRDISGLEKLLDDLLENHARTIPPPGIHERDHERGQLAESVCIFLRQEEIFIRDHVPLYTEASIGLPSTDLPTDIDRAEPVSVQIAPGRRVRVRGRIDRIDKRISDGAYVITDYKSGSNWLYTQEDPFYQGRVVQHLLYIMAVEQSLAESGEKDARVAVFRFLFPTAQTQGEDVPFERETLEEGREVLKHLCDIAGAGCFAPTDDADDCRWCDYALICGDTSSQALTMAGKLSGHDPAFTAMRKLRGYE
jgi:ATP-dependent helicase/nuclease subunit B